MHQSGQKRWLGLPKNFAGQRTKNVRYETQVLPTFAGQI